LASAAILTILPFSFDPITYLPLLTML